MRMSIQRIRKLVLFEAYCQFVGRVLSFEIVLFVSCNTVNRKYFDQFFLSFIFTPESCSLIGVSILEKPVG